MTGTLKPAYDERLGVPLRWWVQATMFLATIWLAFIVALPAWVAWAATGVLVATTYGLFWLISSARIEISGGVLKAGKAHIPVALLGDAQPLDAEGARRVHGVDADARAFLLTRPYLKKAVKVTIDDPADPTPYWLLSTRHPERLAQALGWAGQPASDQSRRN
ncbi:MAG: secreted protein [Marmoricola sp.]|nr:secreted protein [Marmoricola sp.]